MVHLIGEKKIVSFVSEKSIRKDISKASAEVLAAEMAKAERIISGKAGAMKDYNEWLLTVIKEKMTSRKA